MHAPASCDDPHKQSPRNNVKIWGTCNVNQQAFMQVFLIPCSGNAQALGIQ